MLLPVSFIIVIGLIGFRKTFFPHHILTWNLAKTSFLRDHHKIFPYIFLGWYDIFMFSLDFLFSLSSTRPNVSHIALNLHTAIAALLSNLIYRPRLLPKLGRSYIVFVGSGTNVWQFKTEWWLKSSGQAAQSGADYSPFGKLDFSSYLLCLFLYSTSQGKNLQMVFPFYRE